MRQPPQPLWFWCLIAVWQTQSCSVHINTLPQYAESLVNAEPVDAGIPQSLYTLLA